MQTSSWLGWALGLGVAAFQGCGNDGRPGSITATLVVAGVDRTCASPEPVTTCTITGRLEVVVQEETGRDVYLQSMSGLLWDTRGMQDMHATPAVLSSEDIRSAVGTNVVSGKGSRTVPYSLGFIIPEPYILGPVKASVKVWGVDGGGNVTEATCEGFLVAPVR